MNFKSTFLITACVAFYCQDATASWMPTNPEDYQTMTVRCFSNKVKKAMRHIATAEDEESRASWEAKKKQEEKRFAAYIKRQELTPGAVAKMINSAEESSTSAICLGGIAASAEAETFLAKDYLKWEDAKQPSSPLEHLGL